MILRIVLPWSFPRRYVQESLSILIDVQQGDWQEKPQAGPEPSGRLSGIQLQSIFIVIGYQHENLKETAQRDTFPSH